MRLNKTAVALATAALMTLAACSGGSGSGGNEAGGTFKEGGNAGAGKDKTLEGPAEVPEGATEGGTLTVLTNKVPSTLDPTQAYFSDSTAILSGLVTRALTQYTYVDGKMVLVPDMAEGLGKPNKDNTEWTFTLKQGLKYEDGSEVKPEDVAYAIKRSFAIEELPGGPVYQTTYFLDGDKYKGPFQDGDDYAGVVVDGQDITIKMARPFTDMDYFASFPAFTAIPESKDDPANYGQHPIATGPYKFADFKPGSSLTLVKNENWDPATDPGRIQAVDGWEFKFGEDSAKLENVIINDNDSAQTTLTYDNVTPAGYRSIQEDKDRLVEGSSPCTFMWFLDMTKITDKDVRMALGYAFPYASYWKASGEVQGVTREPSTSILPPGTIGRVEYDVLGIDGVNTDAAKAKAMLEKAGETGYEIKFLFQTDDALSVAGKDQIVKGLEAAGFKATPIPSTADTFRTDMEDYKSPINVRLSGWCSDWPSGGSWFPAQWSGDLVGLEGMPNPANFQEADADARQREILDTMTPDEAAQAWGEFDKFIQTKYYPAVTLGYSGTAMIHGSKVGGMDNDEVRGMPTFQKMFVGQ